MRNILTSILLMSQIALLFYSCQSSLEDNLVNEDNELVTLNQSWNEDFIDIKLTDLTNGDSYTLERYNQAKQRLDSVAKFQDGQYYFTVERGSEIGISEELFDHFKEILSKNNQRIQDKYIVEIDGKRLEFDRPPVIRLNGVQSRIPETFGGGSYLGSNSVYFTRDSYWWGYIESATLTNAQALEFFGSMKDAYGQGGDIVGLFPIGWAPALVTWATDAVISLNAEMYANYYNEALTSGASYELWDVYMPDGTPGSPHTYSIKKVN